MESFIQTFGSETQPFGSFTNETPADVFVGDAETKFAVSLSGTILVVGSEYKQSKLVILCQRYVT